MQKFINRFIKNKYFYTTALVAIIYFLYLCIMSIYPFGENSILKCDLYQQYVNFFCYLKEIIINHKSIMFSWNLGLANNFYTTFSYYLASPLNLFVIFFKSTNMDIFIEILTLIKFILIANSAVFYFSKSYSYKKNDVIIFGLIYAFSSYAICYSFHIMWLDCLYMLPITLVYIDKFIGNGKIYPIIICLAYSIWTNYYIGFIVAFFSGIYFVGKYFVINEFTKKNIKKDFLGKLIIFLFAIFIAFGISMIMFIPSISQLKGNMSTDTKLLDINYDKIRLFSNVIFNNYVYMFTQKSCMIFSSTIVTALFPIFYLNIKISKKEKVIFSAIIIFLLMPIVSPFLNKLWHGLTDPNCFYYRYSFALIFLTIIMAFRAYQNLEYSKKTHYIISVLVFAFLTVLEILLKEFGYLESDGYTVSNISILLSCIMYALLIVSLYLLKTQKNIKTNKILKVLLVIFVITDLLIGAKSGQNNNDKYFKRESFTQYDSIMEKILDYIEYPEFERIVFIPDIYGSNMSMKYGYSNIGFFTSARNRETIKAMYGLGYNIQRESELWITSFSGTHFNYDLAGVKLYITKERLEDNFIYGFKYLESYNGYNIYKNDNAFYLGYYLKDKIDTLSKNQFEVQNCFLRDLYNTNEEKEYFEEIEKSDSLICNKDIQYNENSKEYTINYKIHSKKDIDIYICSDNHFQIYIEDKPLFNDYANIWSIETGIKPIKHLNASEDFEFKMTTKSDLNTICIYSSDNENIQKVFDNIQEINVLNNIQINANGLSGNLNFEKDGYLAFSISYDDGWNVYIDGERVKSEAIAGAFLGVNVDAGKHEICIKYEPIGYKVGSYLTIISICVLVIIIIYEKKYLPLQKKNL